MKSMLFSLAAFDAAFSANVFETKYICQRERESMPLKVEKEESLHDHMHISPSFLMGSELCITLFTTFSITLYHFIYYI